MLCVYPRRDTGGLRDRSAGGVVEPRVMGGSDCTGRTTSLVV